MGRIHFFYYLISFHVKKTNVIFFHTTEQVARGDATVKPQPPAVEAVAATAAAVAAATATPDPDTFQELIGKYIFYI